MKPTIDMRAFKECDIRGVYGTEMNERIAYGVGRAVAAQTREVCVAGDVRLSTPELKRALLRGLLEGGAAVTDLGVIPTPVFYYAKHVLGIAGGVMVTASHNPPQYNGLKLMIGDLPVTPEDMAKLAEQVRAWDFPEGRGTLRFYDVMPQYLGMIREAFRVKGKLRVVVDAGNGTTAWSAPAALAAIGCEVVPLYCWPDGRFPNRDPNPAVYAHLRDLQKRVREVGADMGVAFDGDGDRAVFVDDAGEVVQSEEALALMMRRALREPSSVVYDLKSSSVVKRTAEALGSEAIMERSGHAFIKRTFLQHNSALAGEISGHFFFRELGHDDGTYAACYLASLVAERGWKLSAERQKLPHTVITPDLRLPWPYERQQEVIDGMMAFGEQYPVTTLDGVRVDFPEGWLLVRKSVTEAKITLRMEAEDQAGIAAIKERLLQRLPELRGLHEQLQ